MKVYYLGHRSKYLRHGGCYEVDFVRGKYTYLTGLRQRFESINFMEAGDNAPVDPYRVAKPAAPKPEVKLTLGDELLKGIGRNIGVCSFAIEFDNGKRSLHKQAPCHAGLSYDRDKGKPVRVFNALRGYEKNNNRMNLIRYYSYICNESPWRIAFEEPFTPEMIDSGVYLKVDTPKNILVGACIALRQASEFPDRLEIFIRLLDLKYSPNVAFATANLSGRNSALVAREGSGHDIIHRRMNFDELVSFFNDDMFKEKGKPYNDSPGYGYQIWPSIAKSNNAYGKLEGKEIEGTVFGHVMSFFKPNELTIKRGWNDVVMEKHPAVTGADATYIMANILSRKMK
jgi:hypothetical protein